MCLDAGGTNSSCALVCVYRKQHKIIRYQTIGTLVRLLLRRTLVLLGLQSSVNITDMMKLRPAAHSAKPLIMLFNYSYFSQKIFLLQQAVILRRTKK